MKVLSLTLLLFVSIVFMSHKSGTRGVQSRLDSGEHPRVIMRSGVTMDSLYGKHYAGGLIFYFFKDSSGMVLGPKNLTYPYDTTRDRIVWSCRGVHTGAVSTEIGAGPRNTQLIKDAECSLYDPDAKKWMTSAAELCLQYKGGGYTDWFLPSKDELHEACKKLSMSGLYDFNDRVYWSSSEVDTLYAWNEHFRFGPQEFELFGQSGYRKYFDDRVRPVRIFK